MRRLIERYPLRRGAHPTRDDGMCAMEMVAWLAGEAHSDEPHCACPVLAALVRACNDAMDDRARDRFLRPLVPQLINTRSTAAVERTRGLMAIDCAVRTLLPAWLARRGRRDEAALLRALPEVAGTVPMLAARRALSTFVRDRHAALWVLDRARDGLPPERFVADIVQVARTLDDAATWTEVVRLVERMVAAGEPAGAPLSI